MSGPPEDVRAALETLKTYVERAPPQTSPALVVPPAPGPERGRGKAWRLSFDDWFALVIITVVFVTVLVIVPAIVYYLTLRDLNPADPFTAITALSTALLWVAALGAGAVAVLAAWAVYALLRIGTMIRGASTSGHAVVEVSLPSRPPPS